MEESSKSNVTFNIYGGNNQILPNATHAEQHFYGNEFAEKMLAKEGEAGSSFSEDEQRLSIYINNVERRRGYITMLRSCTSAKEVGEVVVAMRQQETSFTDELIVKGKFITLLLPFLTGVAAGKSVDNLRNAINNAWAARKAAMRNYGRQTP